MSENQPPSYPGDPSGEQPGAGGPTPGSSGQQYPGPQYGAPQYGGQQYAGQPYGAAPGGGWAPRPKHPQAVTVLVLGILGLVVCQVLSPFAWVMGNRAVREIDANPGVYDGRGEAQAGRILGIVGTVLLGVVIAFFAFFIVLMIIGIGSASTSGEAFPAALG